MAMSIRNKKAEALARKLAGATGGSLTDAILQARSTEADLADRILDIGRRCAVMPDLDARASDEILGYRQDGAVS